MNAVMLNIDGLSYTYPGAAAPALAGLSLTVRPGECVCLTGNSGCGKTTLLLAIKGLLRDGTRQGTVAVAPAENGANSLPAGIVFQNPEAQIICTTVAEEVAFGPENLCVPAVEISRRVAKALAAVGLDGCAGRSVERFSVGQKQRLTIAAVLSLQPSLLLLDEPSSQLDRPGKEGLAAVLADLKAQGFTLVLAEHDPLPFGQLIDRYLTMESGRIVAEAAGYSPPAVPANGRPDTAGGTPPVFSVQNVSLSYPETGTALQEISLHACRGERLHLLGRNGAGKSSLLRCLAGLERPDAGVVEIAGIGTPRPELLPGKVGVLFQNPLRQLFAESVAEEVAFTLCRLGVPRGERQARVAETLQLCGIAHLADRAPLSLSFGEQHRVALAAVLAPRPGLLLLDEPFAGLDFSLRHGLLTILAAMPARFGTTVLIASHDELPDPSWADRTLLLDGGTLVHGVC
jgi:energy-coupling factor transport system ATP-binding protein